MNRNQSITFSVLTFLAASAGAHAETLEIIGEGSASHAAEFLKIQIDVGSECFASSLEAKNKTDDLSGKVAAVLSGFVDAKVEGQLAIYPGANEQTEKTTYVDNKLVVLCDKNHAWTSSSMIIFKLTAVTQLAELQDKVLTLMPQVAPASGGPGDSGINQPALKMALGRPVPGIFSDTYDGLNDLALNNAYDNALRQANILIKRTPNAKLDVQSIAPTHDNSGAVQYDRTQSSDDPSGTSLGRVSVEIGRKFTFNVTTN